MLRNLILPVVAASFMASAVFALPPKPPELSTIIQSEAPLGKGDLRFLLIKAYEAQLWTDAKAWSYDAPFALSITYNMNFSRQELVDRTIEEIEAQKPLNESDRKALETTLNTVFPQVKENDIITAIYLENGHTDFYHNGAKTGSLKVPELSRRFFDIWLSDKTSEPSLRKNLLGRL